MTAHAMASPSYRRARHRALAHVLSCLNADLLRQGELYLAGATPWILAHDEYRLASGLHFVTASSERFLLMRGYAEDAAALLRNVLRPSAGIEVVSAPHHNLFAIHVGLRVDGFAISLEFARDPGLQFAPPEPANDLHGVSCLSLRDAIARKLMANADRWQLDGMHARDLVDLAMVVPDADALHEALGLIARGKYAGYAVRALDDACRDLLCGPPVGRVPRLARCLWLLQMGAPLEMVQHRVTALRDMVASDASQGKALRRR